MERPLFPVAFRKADQPLLANPCRSTAAALHHSRSYNGVGRLFESRYRPAGPELSDTEGTELSRVFRDEARCIRGYFRLDLLLRLG